MPENKPSINELRIERRSHTTSRLGAWAIGIVVLLILLVAAGLWWLKSPRKLEVRTVSATPIAVDGTNAERIVLNASGYVTARREATVSSKVTGKVLEVLVEEGMKVQEGQILARLDDINVKASLALAEAQADSTRAALEETNVRIVEAELNFKRTQDLAQNNISARAELDKAEAELNSLKARLKQQQAQITVAERELGAWKQQLEDTVIRAPFAGIVTSKNAQPGEMISPVSAGGGFTRTGICTIVDMSSLEVEIDVNEGYINRVQVGQPVTAALDAYPEWKIPCRVLAIIPTADRQKSTVRVRVAFENLEPRILPQMSIKVSFRETTAKDAPVSRAVTLPKTAVQKDNGRDVVMVVQNGRAEQRAVTAVATGSGEYAVTTGLAAGDRVVVEWPNGLKDGVPVKEISQ